MLKPEYEKEELQQWKAKLQPINYVVKRGGRGSVSSGCTTKVQEKVQE